MQIRALWEERGVGRSVTSDHYVAWSLVKGVLTAVAICAFTEASLNGWQAGSKGVSHGFELL